MSDDGSERDYAALALGLFALIFALIAWDLWQDYREGSGWSHVGVELLVLVLAAAGLWRQSRSLLRAHADVRRLRHDLARAEEDARRWRNDSRDLLRGLGEAIEQQFRRWELSRAEAEVGLLLLKGLSLKELADLRQTSERTVREQSRAIYRKAGLAGRAELSAFFLEDLLLPREDNGSDPDMRDP